MLKFLFLCITCELAMGIACKNKAGEETLSPLTAYTGFMPDRIGTIPTPEGFQRSGTNPDSFSEWLKDLPLRKDRTVYLYNGQKKRNQRAQFAVLDVDIGNRDLLQCADVVMKLRASWLFAQKQYDQIQFVSVSGDWFRFQEWLDGFRWKPSGSRLVKSKSAGATTANQTQFNLFMDLVYNYCNTASLERQLVPVLSLSDIQAGDVLVKGGFPGHAVLVADVASRSTGEKSFLLVQGYMPAQDIQVLKNPGKGESPWYDTGAGFPLETPEWVFEAGALKRWE